MKRAASASVRKKTGGRQNPSPKGARITSRKLPSTSKKKNSSSAKVMEWELRLYVAGNTPNSITAFSNLRQMCEQHMDGRYRIEIIDLLEDPQLASGDQIVAIPTLVRRLPTPIKKIIGDLSNTERVLVGLDLKPARVHAAGR